ncbi:glycoside hydrolase family 28 protein [Caulobacter sp. RL271]|jgi:polygalacturonase|uniref:Glycosyl hydrolase family 28 protein n=1 Tax=Caulobacter segnis TaxID=88688 RepID=A0ABY4ZV80_9CAUL|nr:glycosyl hydrolase family 28 protein [Caulobacter segnis]USQ96590.1 glycosyl hydrolase family 28 protein [Caulobacter segnis]
MQRRALLQLGLVAVSAPTLALAAGKAILANAHGAVGDGRTLNTKAIQAAIDEAAKTGATVAFKPGVYRTGSIFLKSGVTLRLDKGVTLLGSQNLADYPELPTRVAGIELTWPAALVNVYKQKNVRIVGDGTIDGDGKVFWDSYWALRRKYDPKGLLWAADYDCKRPRLIQVFGSEQVELAGPRLRRAGFWTVHVCYSHDIHVADLEIRNNEGGRGPSTDGVDIDSSHDVLVERIDVACNDDALCIKAGRDADGLRVARPTRDIVIRDCVIRDASAGVTFGSETSGGFHDIKISGLTVHHPTPVGILFKSAHTRGGTVKNIDISGMDLHDVFTVFRVNLNWNPAYSYAKIPAGMTDVPPYWQVMTQHVPPEQGRCRLSDVRVRDIKAIGAKTAFEVAAFPDLPLEGFAFENLDLDVQAGGRIANARNWTFTRSKIDTLDGKPPEVVDSSGVTGL